MTRKNISDAVSNISERHVEETANFITQRQEIKMKKTSYTKKIIAAAACVCVCILSAIIAWQSGLFSNKPAPISPDQTSATTNNLTSTETTKASNPQVSGTTNTLTTSATTEPTTAASDKTGDGGNSGNTPVKATPQVIGTGFTQQELDSYIRENKENLLSVINAEGITSIKTVSIYKKGIYHVSLGETNTVNLDYITLPILVNGEIYASVVLVKADGEIIETINIGGKTWAVRNDVLFSEPDTEIVFAYLPGGMGEIMIYPDNTAVNPVIGQRQKAADILDLDADWYNLMKTEHNTVSGNELCNAENLVEIYK